MTLHCLNKIHSYNITEFVISSLKCQTPLLRVHCLSVHEMAEHSKISIWFSKNFRTYWMIFFQRRKSDTNLSLTEAILICDKHFLKHPYYCLSTNKYLFVINVHSSFHFLRWFLRTKPCWSIRSKVDNTSDVWWLKMTLSSNLRSEHWCLQWADKWTISLLSPPLGMIRHFPGPRLGAYVPIATNSLTSLKSRDQRL